ncbi:MAG TPA: AMP-binding protein, partial [Arenibaculum sp.]|nr:AMP-binding protein [Arenibaculum sp.]
MDSLNRNDLERGNRIPLQPACPTTCPDDTALAGRFANEFADRSPPPAPTVSGLPLRPGRFGLLTEALDYAAEGRTGCTFHDPRGRIETVLGFARLREEARMQARRLAGLGLRPGDRIGLVAETTPAFLIAFLGCVAAGLVPVPLPVPSACPTRDSYFRLIGRQLRHCGAALFLRPDDPAFHGWQEPFGMDVPELGWSGLDGLPQDPGADNRFAPPAPGDCCYIQYSSGSTSFPRGVAVTHGALLSNCRGIAAALALRADDRVATWLPLYHDMGLVGTFLAALSGQRSIDLMAPESFARRPLLWLRLISRNRATISYGPCFAYDLCRSRTGAELPPDVDLRSWRVAGVGAEMVSSDVMDAFAARFAPAGFRRTAVVASYGLAEATLGVTIAPLGHGLRTDAVDRRALSAHGRAEPVAAGRNGRAGARILVRCGHALEGQDVRIAGPDGEALPARRVG